MTWSDVINMTGDPDYTDSIVFVCEQNDASP